MLNFVKDEFFVIFYLKNFQILCYSRSSKKNSNMFFLPIAIWFLWFPLSSFVNFPFTHRNARDL